MDGLGTPPGGGGSPWMGSCRVARRRGSAQRPERGANLLREQLRLLPRREVAALRRSVVVDEVRIRLLVPAAGGLVELLREDAHAGGNGGAAGRPLPGAGGVLGAAGMVGRRRHARHHRHPRRGWRLPGPERAAAGGDGRAGHRRRPRRRLWPRRTTQRSRFRPSGLARARWWRTRPRSNSRREAVRTPASSTASWRHSAWARAPDSCESTPGAP